MTPFLGLKEKAGNLSIMTVLRLSPCVPYGTSYVSYDYAINASTHTSNQTTSSINPVFPWYL
ncbi:uncharacterized protein METZ01_LOCUS362319 [marine metagenome]|uniref:Uncharacterized protein n=1 Tax=marine metagenome TaxID=408172 RepID=A0A382SJ17_9ZZZZ